MAYLYSLTDNWNSAPTVFDAIKMDITITGAQTASTAAKFLVNSSSIWEMDRYGCILTPTATSITLNNSQYVMGPDRISSANSVGICGYNKTLSLTDKDGPFAFFKTGKWSVGVGTFLTFANGAAGDGGFNTALYRSAAGVLEVNTGTASTANGTAFRLPPQTVAQLLTPGAGLTGAMATVSDALTPTYGATVVGGGAVIAKVWCNGTNWIVG